ncbi:hypothetical protein GCM10028819_50040 [Spirosoma humi]
MQKNPVAVGFLSMAKMEYRFKNNNEGVYHAEFGSMTNEISNDSLMIEQKDQKRFYSLHKSDNGYVIDDGKTKVNLTPQ